MATIGQNIIQQDQLQVPFAPLAGGSPPEVAPATVMPAPSSGQLVPMSGALPVQDQPSPISLPEPLLLPFQDQHDRDMAAIATDVKKVVGTEPNFGHKLLATIAAFKGQFGPAMAIMEQQRSVKLGQSLFPLISRVNRMKVRGDYDGAEEALQQIAGSLGPQGSAYMPVIQKQIDNITQRRDKRQGDQALYDYFDAKLSKDDTRRADLKAFGTLLRNKVNISQATTEQLKHDMGLNIQNQGGRTIATPQGSGVSMVSNLPEAFDWKSVPEIARNLIIAKYQTTPEVLENIVRGVAVPDPENIGYNSPTFKRELQKDLAAASGFVASKDIAAAMPITPEFAQSLKDTGVPLDKIVTRDWTMEQGDAARLDQSRKLGQDELQKLKAQDDRPGSAQTPPVSYYDLQNGNLLPDMTRNIARGQLDRVGVQPTDTYQKIVLPLYRLRNKLDEFELMLPELPDSGNIIGRTSRYIQAKINNLLSTDAQLTDQSTLATVLSSAVDQYANSAGVPAARYQDLRRATSTEFANKQEAAAAITRLKSLIQGEMTQYSTPAQVSEGPVTPAYKGFVSAIGKFESGDNDNPPNSTADAVGRYQIRLGTARPYLRQMNMTDKDFLRPEVNQRAALMHMRDLEQAYPDRPDLAFAAYFSGEGNIDKAKGTIIDPTLRHKNPSTGKLEGPTVQQYVDRAMSELKKQQAAAVLAPKVLPLPERAKGVPANRVGIE